MKRDDSIKKIADEIGEDLGVNLSSSQIDCQDRCPYCNYGPLDGTTGMDIGERADVQSRRGRKMTPKEGDVGICARCAQIHVFTKNGPKIGVRRPTPEEREVFEADPRIRLAVATLRRATRSSDIVG